MGARGLRGRSGLAGLVFARLMYRYIPVAEPHGRLRAGTGQKGAHSESLLKLACLLFFVRTLAFEHLSSGTNSCKARL